MRAQGVVALGEIARALNAGGDSVGKRIVVGMPVLEPLAERTFLAALDELVLQNPHALPQEAVDVVELGHRPGLTGIREPQIVGSGLVGADGDLVAADVVGVRVAAVLVVGRHHVGPEFPHHTYQRFDGIFQGHQGETPLGQRGRRIPLRQSGVDEPQPGVLHTENLGRLRHLVAANFGDVPVHVGQIHRRVENLAALAPGQRHHQHAMTLIRVPGKSGGALTGLVVGVGMHRHQPQFAHVLPCPSAGRAVCSPADCATIISVLNRSILSSGA